MSRLITRLKDGAIVTKPAHAANTFSKRLRGLLGRNGLGPQEGLLISPCRDVHTCGMRFSIDIIFLDRDLNIVRLTPGARAWRFHFGGNQCRHVLEMAAGAIERLQLVEGDQLLLHEGSDRV